MNAFVYSLSIHAVLYAAFSVMVAAFALVWWADRTGRHVLAWFAGMVGTLFFPGLMLWVWLLLPVQS